MLFGNASTQTINLSSIAAGNGGGFAISGGGHGDKSGHNVTSAGDMNGDGLTDLIVSPPLSDPSEDPDARRDSVVFGKASMASRFSPPADRAAARGVHPA